MSTVYDEWKPLRNFLSKLDVIDSLAVIRAYAARRASRGTIPMPSDIQAHPWVDQDNAFLPWELEALAREIIIGCSRKSNAEATLKKSKDIASAVNKMKQIENFIEGEFVSQKNIYHEFTVRLSHRQFKYQTDKPTVDSVVRYSKIFGHPQVAPIVKQKTGLEPKQLFTLGAAIWGQYTTQFGMYYPLENLSLTGITSENYDQFMAIYSKPLDELKSLLLDPAERHMDDKFFYGHHSLITYPIIFTDLDGRKAHICPLPTLLYWRVTSGLYYDLYNEKGFDNAFGSAFEEYVGSVLTGTYRDTTIKVYPGELNSNTSPNRCDWIIDQPNECLVIECKTKRLTMGAKTSLANDNELFAQLNHLGEAIKQAYLSLKAYRDSAYKNPNYTLEPSKKAYICVTTLEKWYLMGPQVEMLHEIVKEKVVNAGLPESILEESPYVVISVDALEQLAFLAKTHAFSEIILPYTKERVAPGWEFANYLTHTFRDELKKYDYVLDNDLQDVYTVKIDETKRKSKAS